MFCEHRDLGMLILFPETGQSGPGASKCQDTPDGWVANKTGYTCEQYLTSFNNNVDACQQWGTDVGTDGVTANEERRERM